jgi:CelD/BcsL family acetyltransferase involved in cellulose biosynthesis
VLELDGEPAAFHFGFEYDGRLIWYKASFAVELRDCGPGEVLLGKLFEYARSRALLELDFTRGVEPFKLRFANATRQSYALRVLPAGIAGKLVRLGLDVKDRFRR